MGGYAKLAVDETHIVYVHCSIHPAPGVLRVRMAGGGDDEVAVQA